MKNVLVAVGSSAPTFRRNTRFARSLAALALLGCGLPYVSGTVNADGRDFGLHRETPFDCRLATDGSVELSLSTGRRGGTARVRIPSNPADRSLEISFPWSHVAFAASDCDELSAHLAKSPEFSACISGTLQARCKTEDSKDSLDANVTFENCCQR
jgi:hypothetical protein